MVSTKETKEFHPWFSFPFGQVYLPVVGILRAAAKMVMQKW
jgi:hypothetical protein